jgi:hypothetical protein
MNNVIQKGGRISYTNTGGTTLKAGVPIVAVNSSTTGYLLIPVDDILAGATGVVATGVTDETDFSLAKKVGDLFTPLQIIYWDSTNAWLTVTSSGMVFAGRSDGTYASAATAAGLLLNRR